MKKGLLGAFLAMVMLFGFMTTSAFAVGGTSASNAIKVASEADFTAAIAQVNSDPSKEYTIELTGSIQVERADIKSPCKVTILGNGNTLTFKQYGYIGVEKGAQLTLGSTDGNVLNISSVSDVSNDTPGMFYVQGTCNMYAGVTLSGRTGENYFGGGVTVSGGSFHMYGGTIEKCGIKSGSVCYGGGVAVINGGQFVMDNGAIQDCFVESDYADYDKRCLTAMGGGVFVTAGSSFVMNGGTISNNRATNMGGGVATVASYEEVAGGFGNLTSSTEILGGTITENTAMTGAGVFASAYYYAYAEEFTPTSSTAGHPDNPGLTINNTQITSNTADETEGYGGGVFVAMLKSPAVANIEKATITGNTAALGGGIVSYGYWTKMAIDGCTVTGNAATIYGGGFVATNNSSGGKTTITDTALCNNIADAGASDAYLRKSSVSLPSALSMDSLYLGEPDEVCNHRIDSWCFDTEDSRYTAQDKDSRAEYAGYADISSSDEVFLIAAVKPLIQITFTNEDGSEVYKEAWYPYGTAAEDIELPTVRKESDETYDYFFKEWSPAVEDATQDAVYVAVFEKAFKEFKAQYEFESATDGEELPDEVVALLPEDETAYARDSSIEAITPAQTTVKVDGGKWVFTGFDNDTLEATMENADDAGYVTFVGSWEFEADDEESSDVSDDDKASAGSKGTPQTGDGNNVFLWLTLALASGGALAAARLASRRMKFSK